MPLGEFKPVGFTILWKIHFAITLMKGLNFRTLTFLKSSPYPREVYAFGLESGVYKTVNFEWFTADATLV